MAKRVSFRTSAFVATLQIGFSLTFLLWSINLSYLTGSIEVQAVQEVIHFTHESRTYIQSSIKTHPQNPLDCLESCIDLLPCYRLKLMLMS